MNPTAVFLSYSSADRRSVAAFQKLLQGRGITTFLDRDDLAAGLAWPQALEQGLGGVHAVAVLIGRQLGGWQKREMWFALDRQVREEKQGRAFPVIPVLLPGADLTPSFLFLNTWVDLRDGLDAVEALDAFHAAVGGTQPAQTAGRAEFICPYRGLQVFREEDAAFFAGRRSFSKQLLDFTLGKDLVAVVGPSGSGKSSVVQAGLLPLLRRERPPAQTWDAVTFTPGNEPFHRLAAALIPLLELDADEVEWLAKAEELGVNLVGGRTRVESVINRVIEKSNGTGRLLVVADQFEELFTLTAEPARRPFARALLRALDSAPFTLLLTLRADFYSQIITLDRELSDRLAPAQVNIGALTRDELRETIVVPAGLVGLEFEAGLVERILSDAGGEPGRLPLVEFALAELWQRREAGRLGNQAYDEIQGVTGALAWRAEEAFGRLNPEEQTAARRLFSRLVRVARPEEAGQDTRQRTGLSHEDMIASGVANRLADARLLVTGGETDAGTLAVEIAHEALIRNWERLRGWLNEDREFLLWRQRLQAQVEDWRGHGLDGGYLLRGAPLSEAESWFLGREQNLADAEQHFIRESIALREREREEENERRQAEVENANRLKEAAEARAVAEQQRATEQARRATVLWGSSLVLGALLLLTFVLAGVALKQRSLARARELVAASRITEPVDPELSVLIAAKAVEATWWWRHTVLPEAEEQLHRSVLAAHERVILSGHRSRVQSVAWSPNGKRLATGSEDHTAKVWNAETGQELLTLTGHTTGVTSVAWSPDGGRLATASWATARVWDAGTGKELLTLSGHTSVVTSVAWSPDGKRLATGNADKTARVWDAGNGQELLTLSGHTSGVTSVAWSPDGKRLATGSGDTRVWDLDSGKELLVLKGHLVAVQSVAWSPDGKRLATGSGDAKVWDAETGREFLTLSGHRSLLQSLAWSPDGKRLGTGGADGTAKVWDAASGQELLTLTGHTGVVTSVAWRRDGERLATASWDGTARVWDAGSDKESLTLSRQSTTVNCVAWSPDGKRLVTGSRDGSAKVWDAESGRELLTLVRHPNPVTSVAWSPDGSRLATAGWGRTAKMWDARDGRELLILSGHREWIPSVAWSPDGRRLATGSADNTAMVWNAETGQPLVSLSRHDLIVTSVAWSPEGNRIATGSVDATAKIWDAESGRELRTLRGHTSTVNSVAWSPDGKRLATSSNEWKVWDAGSGGELWNLSAPAGSVAWSPDGKRIAAATVGHAVKVWDAWTGDELLTLRGHTSPVTSVAWSPDGNRLATASSDGTVQTYAMNIHDLMALARQRVTAHPSAEKCKQYLRADKCPPVPELSLW